MGIGNDNEFEHPDGVVYQIAGNTIIWSMCFSATVSYSGAGTLHHLRILRPYRDSIHLPITPAAPYLVYMIRCQIAETRPIDA
jgi:hypothetical protein